MNNKDVLNLIIKLRGLMHKAGYRKGWPRPVFEVVTRPWINTQLSTKNIKPVEKRDQSAALTDGRWIYAVFQPIITFRETAELIAEILNVLPKLLDALEERIKET